MNEARDVAVMVVRWQRRKPARLCVRFLPGWRPHCATDGAEGGTEADRLRGTAAALTVGSVAPSTARHAHTSRSFEYQGLLFIMH